MQVKGTYDVVVVGGGTSGVAAAISAARTGANTLLIERVGALGGQQFVLQPVQAFARDHAGGPTGGHQHIDHGIDGACRAVGNVPGTWPIGVDGFVKHGLGGNFCGFKSLCAELTI